MAPRAGRAARHNSPPIPLFNPAILAGRILGIDIFGAAHGSRASPAPAIIIRYNHIVIYIEFIYYIISLYCIVS